jgi:hypothetical protein
MKKKQLITTTDDKIQSKKDISKIIENENIETGGVSFLFYFISLIYVMLYFVKSI